MSAREQTMLLGEPTGKTVEIETDGRTIRPFFALPTALVDECKLEVREDGLGVTAVDPANVVMVDVTIHADAFDAFDVSGEPPFDIGLPLETLRTQLSDARLGKRTNDPVTLRFDESAARVEITRDYDQTTVERADEFLTIDPDSVRERPELPDLDLNAHATVDLQALTDVIEHFGPVGNVLTLDAIGDDLRCRVTDHDNDGDLVRGSTATFTDCLTTDSDAGASYSMDYVSDFADGLSNGRVDDVTVRFGDEFPAMFDFARTDSDDETLYEGRYMIAPRIEKEDAI
jgi:proliferating cell nuclear antigen